MLLFFQKQELFYMLSNNAVRTNPTFSVSVKVSYAIKSKFSPWKCFSMSTNLKCQVMILHWSDSGIIIRPM